MNARGENGGIEQFATTRWSMVLSCADARSEDEQKREALAQLCRTYWRPIFAFITHKGYSAADAQDLTQDFFLNVLQGNLLKLADPARGRFRSLLLKALQNFLNDAEDRQRSQKRGGQIKFIDFDSWMAEGDTTISVSE